MLVETRSTQLLKGTLDMCMLATIAQRHISSVPLSNCVERVSTSISPFHSLA